MFELGLIGVSSLMPLTFIVLPYCGIINLLSFNLISVLDYAKLWICTLSILGSIALFRACVCFPLSCLFKFIESSPISVGGSNYLLFLILASVFVKSMLYNFKNQFCLFNLLI